MNAGGPPASYGARAMPYSRHDPLVPSFDIAEAVPGELDALLEKNTKPHEVARALISLLRAGPPSIVVLEDLHRADEATLDVLRLLGRKLGSIPVLLIGTIEMMSSDVLIHCGWCWETSATPPIV